MLYSVASLDGTFVRVKYNRMRHNMLWLYFAPTSFTRVYLSEDLSSVTLAKMLFDVLSNAKYEVMAVVGLNLISSSKLLRAHKNHAVRSC